MSGADNKLKQLIQEAFVPEVCVFGTADAVELLQRHSSVGLGAMCGHAASMRRPMGLTEAAASAAGRPHSSSEGGQLPWRLVPGAELERAEEQLVEQLAAAAAAPARDDLAPLWAAAARVRTAAPPRAAWFELWRQTLLGAAVPAPHEALHSPVLVLVLVPAANTRPVDAVTKLQLSWLSELGPLLRERLGDPTLQRHYVVLHEPGAPDEPLAELRTMFGAAHVSVLRLPRPPAAVEAALPAEAARALTELLVELGSRVLTPHLEQRIRQLNEQINAKRGITNKLRTYLFGTGGAASAKQAAGRGSDDAGSSEDGLSGAEWQARQLADLLLMVRDYEAAQLLYKSLAQQSRNPDKLRTFAGAVEMYAVCTALLEPGSRDVDGEFDKAFAAYCKVGISAARFATRTALLWGELARGHRAAGTHATLLARAADRPELDDLTAALLHEQAGLAHLSLNPPAPRRFALRLLYAGQRFACADQRRHALRCYGVVQALVAPTRGTAAEWTHVQGHAGAALARLASLLGRRDDALRYLRRLLERAHALGPARQAALLREYLHVLAPLAAPASLPAPDLPLLPFPLIAVADDTLRVFLQGSPAGGEAAATDAMWADMEAALLSGGGATAARANNRKRRKRRDASRERQCVAGEPIAVQLQLHNPYAVPLPLSHVHLLARLDDDAASAAGGGFEVQAVDLVLAPGERRTVKLLIVPQREGRLQLYALGMCVAGRVWGVRPLELPRRRLNDTPAHKLTPSYAPDLALSFRVCADMPALELAFSPTLPAALCHGEVRALTLQLRNAGRLPLHRVRLLLSHPAFFSFAQAVSTDRVPLPAPLLASGPLGRRLLDDGSVLELGVTLKPGAALDVPLWFRGSTLGTHALYFLLMYEPTSAGGMPYRLAKLAHEVRVLPALRVHTTLSESSGRLDSYVLALDCENLLPHKGAALQLTQLTAVSQAWGVQPLSPAPATLGPRETATLLVRVTPLAPPPPPELLQLSRLPLLGVAPPAWPHADLLLREKQHAAAQQQATLLARSKQQTELTAMHGPRAPARRGGAGERPELDLVLFWQSDEPAAAGQLHVVGLSPLAHALDRDTLVQQLQPPAGLPLASASLAAADQPLRYVVRATARLRHDFALQPVCCVRVEVAVRNMATRPLRFYVDALKPGGGDSARGAYVWSGVTRTAADELEPRAERSHLLLACFSRAGVFDLARFKLVLLPDPPAAPPLAVPASATAPPVPAVSHAPHELFPTVQHLLTIEALS